MVACVFALAACSERPKTPAALSEAPALPDPEPLPLERLLEPRQPLEPSPAFRDYRHTERPVAAGPPKPLPEGVSVDVFGEKERIEVGGPGRSIDSTRVGASLEYRPDDDPAKPAISLEGAVRDDRSEDLPEEEERDESVRVKIDVPFGSPD